MRACSHERLSAAFLNEVAVLIQNPPVPRDNAPASFGLRLQQFNFGYGMDRIAEDDGTMKFPFEDRHECQGVNARSLAHQSRGNGQAEETVCDGPSEGVAPGGRMVDMQRIEVSRQAGEEHDIGFRHCSSWALPFITDDEIIKRAN